MASLQEYDMDFKHSHIVKGHELCKLTIKASDQKVLETDQLVLEEEEWEHEIEMYQNGILGSHGLSLWYSNLKQYLVQGFLLETLSTKQKRAVKIRAATYQIAQGNLFKKHHLSIPLRCLEYEKNSVSAEGTT